MRHCFDNSCKAFDFSRGLFTLSFGNTAFLGFPVAAAISGVKYVFYAALLTLPYNLIVFTSGRLFIAGHRGVTLSWRLFTTPTLLALYAAVLLILFDVRLPAIATDELALTGQITVPASLLVIGSSLADIPLLPMFRNLRLLGLCVLRLFVVPLIVTQGLRFVPLETSFAQLIALMNGMPVAAYGVMFCAFYGVNPKTMAEGTVLTTFLSMFSIPLLVTLL